MIRVFISSETDTLGPEATQDDLDRYARNLANHLAERFGQPVEVEQVAGHPRPCPDNDEINDYVVHLQRGDDWLGLL